MNPVDFLGKNLFLKILSLIFAIILWFFVVLEDKVEQDVDVSIHCLNISKKLVLVKPPPEKILVKVVGPRSILRNLSKKVISLDLDLKDFSAGRHTIHIYKKMLPLPGGLEIVAIEPEEFEIELQRLISRKLLVEPVLVGSPPGGWKVSKIEVIPKRVTICGPEGTVLKLRKVKTKPIDITNQKGLLIKEVELSLPYQVKSILPSGVKVRIEIKEKIVEREIKDLPIKIVGKSQGVSLYPSKVTALLKGPENLLGPFAQGKIGAVIDTKNLRPGTWKVKIKMLLPPGVKIIKLHPRIVRVTIPKNKK